MLSFNEWMNNRLDEAAKKGKPRKSPVAKHDIETWLKEIESLKKDLEELKKAKKIAAQRLVRLAAIKKPEPKKPETKKPEPKKPEPKKPVKKQDIKKIKKKQDAFWQKPLAKRKNKKKNQK